MNFGDVWAVVGSALRLDPATLNSPPFAAHPWAVALIVGFLAALGNFVGHIVVLAVNQVRGARLALASCVIIVGYVAQYVVQGFVLWLLGLIFVDSGLSLVLLIQVMLVAMAPRMFSFLLAIPYTGPFFGAVTSVWSLMSLWAILFGAFDVSVGGAFALALGSGIALNLTGMGLSKPLSWARDHVWHAVTGSPMLLTAQDIQGRYVMDEDEWRRILYEPPGSRRREA